MSRARKSLAAAAAAVVIAGGAVVASRTAPPYPPAVRMCTTQPSDGGVCIYLEPNHGTHLVRFASSVVFPAERALGQCETPSPCPREP